MSMGKAMAQAAHASSECLVILHSHLNSLEKNRTMFDSFEKTKNYNEWRSTGMTKIVLSIKGEEKLVELINKARLAGLPYSLIVDEGRTEFTEPTVTCGAIGPASEEEINAFTKRLRLF